MRLALAEKAIGVEIINVNEQQPPEDLIDLNPLGSVPTLVDRDLVLYDSRVIIEYLDERFPHPPLLPPDPVSRARFRLGLTRIENDWYSLLPELEGPTAAAQARQQLTEGLLASIDAFAAKPFFLSDELSMLDCTLAPILWRLPAFGIVLPAQAKPVQDYARRMFSRSAFRASLSHTERHMNL